MHKKEQIIVAVLVLALLGGVYALLAGTDQKDQKAGPASNQEQARTSGPEQPSNRQPDQGPAPKMTAERKTEYKQELRGIYRQYANLWQENVQTAGATARATGTSATSIKTSKLENMQKELLNLRVPKEFKDLHLKLAMALSKGIMASHNTGEAEPAQVSRSLSQMKQTYPWLATDRP